MALIDQWLGRFDYAERHSIEIHAKRGDVYRALTRIDLGDSRLIGWLFSLRGVPLPARDGDSRLPMTDFLARFTALARREPEELLVGAVGRFWQAKGGMVAVGPQDFRDYAAPGVAKLVMTFVTEPLTANRTRLITETRVWCSDKFARRRFRFYWYLIRPASGIIRREMLRLIKRRAERGS